MKPHYRSYFSGIAFLFLVQLCDAQQAKDLNEKIAPASKDISQKTLDSLGDAYLSSGDTSQAIYYYQKANDLYPASVHQKALIEKLRKKYQRPTQSFYLKEY